MKKLFTVLCFGLAALARADAPTALTVPDSTPLFSWADPYALGRGLYLDGAFFAVTNNPDITLTTSNFVVRVMGTGAVDPLARAAASNAQATADAALPKSDTNRFATAAQGEKADSALQPASTNALATYAAATNAARAVVGAWSSTGMVTRWFSPGGTDWVERVTGGSVTEYQVYTMPGVRFSSSLTSSPMSPFAGTTWVIPSTNGPMSIRKSAGVYQMFTNEYSFAYFFASTNSSGQYTGWTTGDSHDDSYPPIYATVILTNTVAYAFFSPTAISSIAVTNAHAAIGSTDTNQAKVYISGESGYYTNKPLVVLNRSNIGTGNIQEWRTNGVIVASVDPLGRWTGDGSLLTGKPSYSDVTNAAVAVPAFSVWTNQTGSVTISNTNEAPVKLYGTGAVSVAFSGLRPPRPLYLVMRGPSSVSWPANTHFVGGGTWQTNMSNHFVVWSYGTNLFVNPVTASED